MLLVPLTLPPGDEGSEWREDGRRLVLYPPCCVGGSKELRLGLPAASFVAASPLSGEATLGVKGPARKWS